MAIPSETAFGRMQADNILAANQFHGSTINFGRLDDSNAKVVPQVCRAIHFPRNEAFVHRSTYSDELARLLPSRQEYQRAALWGLGGSGKTQLALDYAYNRCSDPACSVFWVHADTETSFTHDYRWIATKLGLTNNSSDENILETVRVYIESLPNWVMVLDNADDLMLFGVGDQQTQGRDGGTNLSVYIPRGSVGTILWTGRDQRITSSLVGPGRGINVVCMEDAEAEILFRNHAMAMVGNKDDRRNEGMAKLLSELGWLPLAITQAAAYIRQTNTSADEYLKSIQRRKRRWKRLTRAEPDPQRRPEVSNSVLETWNISMGYIKKESPLAYRILMVPAYVDNHSIPFELIAEIAHGSIGGNRGFRVDGRDGSASEEDDGEDKDAILEAISRLEDFSFLTIRAGDERRSNISDRSYDMHRLVQEAISYNLRLDGVDSKEEANSAKTIFKILDRLFPHDHGWSPQRWAICEKYLGHAQRAGDWAQSHRGEEDVAKLLVRVSNYLYGRGRWTERETVDEGILKLRKAALGPQHLGTIASQARLSVTYYGLGRYKEAEQIQLEVLALRRKLLGDRHPDTIWSMTTIATTYCAQGNYAEAEQIDLEVLSLRRAMLGSEHSDTISSLASLATTYHMQRRYDESEQIKAKVLKLRRKKLGDKHHDTISSMVSLAATYFKQRRFEAAEKIEVEVLGLRRQTLGDDHPDTIHSMGNLAATYHEQCRLEEAEKIEIQVLNLRQHSLGHQHPHTIQAMANLASTYYRQRRHGEAEKTGVEVLRLRMEVLGRDHPDTIISISNLGLFQQASDTLLDTEVDGPLAAGLAGLSLGP